jgi:hypothetical protein
MEGRRTEENGFQHIVFNSRTATDGRHVMMSVLPLEDRQLLVGRITWKKHGASSCCTSSTWSIAGPWVGSRRSDGRHTANALWRGYCCDHRHSGIHRVAGTSA